MLQLVVPLKEFLEPVETDVQLLNVYLHALATGKLLTVTFAYLRLQ